MSVFACKMLMHVAENCIARDERNDVWWWCRNKNATIHVCAP